MIAVVDRHGNVLAENAGADSPDRDDAAVLRHRRGKSGKAVLDADWFEQRLQPHLRICRRGQQTGEP